jgi:hypothetical protein
LGSLKGLTSNLGQKNTYQKALISCTIDLAGTGILQESGGIRTKYRNSCPAGIPAKNSCDGVQKPEFLGTLQNHVPVKNSSGKHRKKEKSSGILFFSVFDPQIMNS